MPASAAQFPAGATNLGTTFPDPTGTTTCGNLTAAPLDYSFTVSGLTSAVSSLGLRLNIAHTWRADLIVTLIAPGGSPSFVVFGRTGATTAGACGSGSDLLAANTYNFGDGASSNWWTTTATPTPAGDYRTSEIGNQASGGTLTSLGSAFAGLPAASANGTWTLRIQDTGVGDTGSLTGATLFIDEPVPVSLQSFGVD